MAGARDTGIEKLSSGRAKESGLYSSNDEASLKASLKQETDRI